MILSTAATLPPLLPGAGLRWNGVLSLGWAAPLAMAGLATWALWTLPEELAAPARIALIVTVLAMIGWTCTRIPESLVALAAAMALVVTGTVGEGQLYATLGSELVWLLLAAFIIAAVIKDAGLAERMVAPLTAARPRFAAFALVLAGAIAATALILPSTSGRAALLLPVFLALLPLLPDPRLARALALLFPTVILLSAGGSLIGAGAHLSAVEAIAATGAPRLGYLDWLLLAGPFAALASAAAVVLILWLFVPRTLWSARMQAAVAPGPGSAQQRRILAVVVILVALWLTEPLHGLGMALVAMLGALALLTRPFTSRKTKDLFRAVDMELILYMAATMLIAKAMTQSGADRWLAKQAMAALPPEVLASGPGIAVALSVVAVLAHLAVASRSARAAILIPAVALPMAGMGHDATLMILIAVMGTGFCQTLMSSAKPVAIFGLHETAGFTQADLLRLALPLGLVKTGLLVGFALCVWPQQTAVPASPAPTAVLASAMRSANAAMPEPAFVASASASHARPPAGLTSDLRTALADMPAQAVFGPSAVFPTSPRPLARPEGLGLRVAMAPPAKPVKKTKKKVRKAAFGAQLERDLSRAARQIERDLGRLFN